MLFHKKQILFCLLFLLGAYATEARRLKKYHRTKARHNIERSASLLRQANPVTSSATGANDDNAVASTGTNAAINIDSATGTANNVSPNPADALVLINPTKSDSSPRLFKGLLFQALMANRGAQSSLPYIIVNVPNNITNINQNNLNNTSPAPPITTPITTPTSTQIITPITTPISSPTTVTVGTRGYPIPQGSQIVHQRGSKPKREEDYPQNFIRSPSNQLLPVYLPPEIQNLLSNRNVVRRRGGQRKRVQNKRQSLNPFAAFANSLRRIQYG